MRNEEATKERHAYYKNIYRPRSKLDRAVRWYYLNRTSYSGIMNFQNCYWGYGEKFSMRVENWERNIMRTSNKLQDVQITSTDFSEVLLKELPNAFFFIDPPYFNADQSKFYACPFVEEDHYRLASALKHSSKKIKFLLTYDNSPEIRDLYSWCEYVQEAEWNYTINRTDDQKKSAINKKMMQGKRYKGKELFIANFQPAEASQLLLNIAT